ncbi:hypothetical protein PLICRDRAFT_121679, partial [Plicaturopsis crispa FD-325 SS-3]
MLPEDEHKNQYRGYRHPFLNGTQYLGGVGDVPRTLSELAMCYLSAEIRRQESDWWSLIADDDFRNKWIRRAMQRTWIIPIPSAAVQLTERQINYTLDELAGYALLRDTEYHCEVSCFDRIWESNDVLSSSELGGLNQAIAVLREPSQCRRRRSEDGVTTALVDPHLHCLVYGRTLVQDRHNRGLLNPMDPPYHAETYTVSRKAAMLPTDFSVSAAGGAKALGYINNIDPQHALLHSSIETVVEKILPMFEHVLTDLHRNNPLHQRIRESCHYTEWDEPEPPEFSDDEDGWVAYGQELERWMMERPIRLPDVPEAGYTGRLEQRKHVVSLKGRTVQMIVDISEVRLQPNGPNYTGSTWKVAGMRNERIVACAFYCVSMQNIVDSSTEFRMAVTSPRGFSAGDTGATVRTWGFQDGEAQVQQVGSAPLRAGFGIAFPNIYQHRSTPLHLLDPTKEGHQTVLTLFLVDPEIQPIISTSRVPPQQKGWIRRAVEDSADARFPVELVTRIVDEVDGLMTQEDAERCRSEVLEDRAKFQKLNDAFHFCIPFDVWNELAA